MNIRMNRLEWVLSGMAALLLALVVGLVFMVHAGQSMGQDQEAASGEFDASLAPPPLTARAGFEAAWPTAQAWADDAQLWRAQATWPMNRDLQAPPAAWTFTFYSPSRGTTAMINTTVGGARLLRTRPTSNAPNLAEVDEWQIDSSEAFALLYESGGEAFLTVHPKHTMMLTLQLEEPARWQVNLINEGAIGNAAGRQMLTLLFRADDGRLITELPQGDDNEES